MTRVDLVQKEIDSSTKRAYKPGDSIFNKRVTP